MAYPGYQNSLLLIQFREFYQELAQLKQIAIRRLGSIPEPASQQEIIPAVQPDDIWRRLLTLLESQAERASRSGGAFAFEVYREAQYVMAALADEFFLNENWPGRQNWPLLETRLFHTAAAGDVVFKKLDLLMLHRDPVYLDLAAVYFFALSLGFQGKFRGSSRQKELERYKHQLFVMIFRHNPELLQKGNHVIPQTYLHTLAEGKIIKLPHPRRWLLVLATVILLWLTGSHLLWYQLTGTLDAKLQTVEAGAKKSGNIDANGSADGATSGPANSSANGTANGGGKGSTKDATGESANKGTKGSTTRGTKRSPTGKAKGSAKGTVKGGSSR